jgi:LPS export ABC transporter protein LptC
MNIKNLSKKKRVYLMIILALTGILLWAYITARVITHDFNRQQVAGKQDQQEAVVKGIILTETKDEHKYWEIYAETGKYDSSNGIAQLNDVIANFFDDKGVSMSLKSSKGTYDSASKVITLYEKTFIVISGGITLNADKLTYVNSKTPIVAEGHVKVRKDNELLSTADKIVISPNYESFKIIGNTVSKVYEDKK